jgi:hypothetical protein
VIVPHLPRADLPVFAADIDALITSASGISGNAIYQWTAIGWR